MSEDVHVSGTKSVSDSRHDQGLVDTPGDSWNFPIPLISVPTGRDCGKTFSEGRLSLEGGVRVWVVFPWSVRVPMLRAILSSREPDRYVKVPKLCVCEECGLRTPIP